MAAINPYVFREYDIRGVVSRDFDPGFVELLGRGFGTFVHRRGGRRISLSGDVRLTTPDLKNYFRQGVLSTGVDIIDIGIVPTPANYFSLFALDVDGSCQVTGSHNPPEMNGFKLSFQRGAVYGSDIQEIRRIVDTGDFEQGAGAVSNRLFLPDYVEMLWHKIALERPLKVAMDCGNAAACLVAPDLAERLGIRLTRLFCDVDGCFPNHHPDPTVAANLASLRDTVVAEGLDVGIAYDGDADRVGVIDDRGEIVWADMLMALFLPEIVQPGDTVLFDVKCSQLLEDEILRLGGRPFIWKTGHSLIKQKMKELGCRFGGEMSGHIFFADDYYGYDDAIYVSMRLLQMLSRRREKLSQLTAALPRYHATPEMRLECSSDREKFRIATAAADFFKREFDCLDTDGVRIRFGDGWGLVRASNTQPVIVCRFEARTAERMEEIRDFVLEKLGEFGEIGRGGY